MENIEIEFKNLLTQEEYGKIYNEYNLKNISNIINTNYYYETMDYKLKKHNSALRVRISNILKEITLKTKGNKGNLEINVPIKDDKILKTLKLLDLPIEIRKNLNFLDCSDELILKHKIETHRKELKLQNGVLVLDKTIYLNNVVDYELEFEVANYEKGKEEFLLILKNLSIERKKALPKIARAEKYALK